MFCLVIAGRDIVNVSEVMKQDADDTLTVFSEVLAEI